MNFLRFLLVWFKSFFVSSIKNVSLPAPQLGAGKEVPDSQLTKNFHIDEFSCNDGTPVPPELYGNVLFLAQNLQVLRDALGVPIKIVDGYRTSDYNKNIGGKSDSRHLSALAADFVVSSVGETYNDVLDIIDGLMESGEMESGGVGDYRVFVHYDCSGDKIEWNGVS